MAKTVLLFSMSVFVGCAQSIERQHGSGDCSSAGTRSTNMAGVPEATTNLVVAARALVEGLDQRLEGGEAATPAFVQIYCTASHNLAEAESLQSSATGSALHAWEAHLQRMAKFHRVIHGYTEGAFPLQRLQMEYFLREAELQLARQAAPAK